jgi:hypothetical protein
MQLVVAPFTHRHQVIVLKRQLRPGLQVLDVVHYISPAKAALCFAPLTFMVISL